jgi:uncharacterized protein YegL
MTQQDYTEIQLVVDRSGSMSSIKTDMEGGIAEFVKAQAEQPGTCKISLTQFDDYSEQVRTLVAAGDWEPYTLVPRNMTALYDAIGTTIASTGQRLAALEEDQRPGHVIVVIVTDGLENRSREYGQSQINEMITHQREKYGWEFVFLGANQDAITTGVSLGFAEEHALDFDAETDAIAPAMASLNANITRSRLGDASGFTQEERRNASRRRS